MTKNHEQHALQNPAPYQGGVPKANTPLAAGENWSIIEAANYYDAPPLLARFGVWAITKAGIDCLWGYCHISKDRLDETDWVKHMTEKNWVDRDDFAAALKAAKDMVATGQI